MHQKQLAQKFSGLVSYCSSKIQFYTITLVKGCICIQVGDSFILNYSTTVNQSDSWY